jgi:hypothetical protein
MSGLKFVFCEGGDDLAVTEGVAASMNLKDLRIEPFLGKDNLRRFLTDLQKRPEFARNKVAAIAVIRDADDNGSAAFQSVRGALEATGFAAPSANGLFAEGAIKTGILVVGPKNGRGMVEDLCLNSVSDRPEFVCVEDYFRCIEQKSERRNFTSKAKIRVWMASHVDYDLRVGKAAERGYWPWENPVFNPVREFLSELCR